MKAQQVTDLQVNGFVDGELPPAEAAYVAEAVAANPALAQRVARLHRMKAALRGYGDSLPLPEAPPVAQRGRGAARIASRSVAAVALLCLLLWPGASHEPDMADLPRLAQHDHWLDVTTQIQLHPLPPAFEWMSDATRASGLQLVHHYQDGQQVHLGFKGRHDCRLSLFVAPTVMPDAPLRLTLSDSVQHALWQRQGFAFEMVARDMAPARFATLSTALQQGSGAHGDRSMLHVALLGSARLPCLG